MQVLFKEIEVNTKMVKWRLLSVLLFVLFMTGLCNGCLAPGRDYDFRLRLTEKLIGTERGRAWIPCAFTAPMRVLSGRQVWFRRSPEFPLSPAEVQKKDGLMRPMISTESECSVVLRDAWNTSEEYGFMLEWGANERHIFPDRVKVASCVGDYDFRLRLTEKLIGTERGRAWIPCAFTAPMRVLSGRQVWFRRSPEFPLSPAEVQKKDGLMRPMISTESECSVVLRDAWDTPEEYGFMLEWGANERHIFPDRVKVASCVAKVELTPSTYSKNLLAGKETFLNCSLSKHCPGIDPKITWKGFSSKPLLTQKSKKEMHEYSGYSEWVLYTPVPEDHQAEITCEATFGKNLSASAKTVLTVHSHPQILNSSACSLQQNLLTCVCVSQGVPLPDIHWPLLQNKLHFTKGRASYVTVRSTFTMTVVNFTSNSTVMCVSRNYLGQTNMTLPVNITEGLRNAYRWKIKGLVIALFITLTFCVICFWMKAKYQKLSKVPYSSLEKRAETLNTENNIKTP